MTIIEPKVILSIPLVNCDFQQNDKTESIQGRLLVLLTETSEQPEIFIDIIPANESIAGRTIPVVPFRTQVIYNDEEMKLMLMPSPIMTWKITIQPFQCDSSESMKTLSDILNEVTGSIKYDDLKGEPRNSLLALDHDGKVVGQVETDFGLISKFPNNLSPHSPVIIDASTNSVQSMPTNSKTVKLGQSVGIGIEQGGSLLGMGIKAAADFLIKSSSPQKQTISPQTIQRIQKFQEVSSRAVKISNIAAGTVKSIAGKIGESIAHVTGDKSEKGSKGWKLTRNAALALDEIGNSFDRAMIQVVDDSKVASSKYIGHKYGPDAVTVSDSVLNIVRNATLVYIDVSGVSRKAIVKGIGKGAIKYKLKDGSKVTVTEGGNGALKYSFLNK
jgi:hypothetical protein